MIGDKIVVQSHHIPPAQKIMELINDEIKKCDGIYFINISGESGCGKSTLAIAIEMLLDEKGISSYIFHMDDYFKLPPSSNHKNRLLSLDNVGMIEVNLDLLQKHIDKIKTGELVIQKPLVHYKDNRIHQITADLTQVKVVIIEGTYTSILGNIDCKIFIDRTYKDTYQQRLNRGREDMSDFIESVLEIEHNIIQSHKYLSRIILDQSYSVSLLSDQC
ncbi:MAG TPA: hypothetical protein PKD85_19595 [Saprospiraceae bacterium]|nr:hypothetical protein [Saprospiraceae bacterium]